MKGDIITGITWNSESGQEDTEESVELFEGRETQEEGVNKWKLMRVTQCEVSTCGISVKFENNWSERES